MKIYTILSLILFCFSSNVIYEAEEYTCENNEIRVKYIDNWYSLSLFNVLLKEDTNICGYIHGNISFEFEPAVKSKDEVYLYVDDVLLQEVLIDHNEAEVLINSLAYKYSFQKKEKVIATAEEKTEKKYYSRYVSYGVIGMYFLLIIGYMVYKLHLQKDININENDV